ncbi:nucleotidyl transferase AbiEii/AbiGii toxin family protein [bacterium]|nr:nucleotidyl transferase AbiEii/AbiGii toxin family protein [bacterium]
MNDLNSVYYRQSHLLLRILPFLTEYPNFALKGGTAINFFMRNMPRLSVDIDLVYLPVESREQTLSHISSHLVSLAERASKSIQGLSSQTITLRQTETIFKLLLRQGDVQIKIEPNLVMRGAVRPCENRALVPMAKKIFQLTVDVKTLSLAEVYAGKICAALDRQHPRDLFDVKLLLENEGITEDITKAFTVYLASHDRPMHELLDPNRKDIKMQYENEFYGLGREKVELDDLLMAREQLISTINEELPENDRSFLISLKSGEPDWSLIEFDGIENLPAVRWKLINIRKMSPGKRENQLNRLRHALER